MSNDVERDPFTQLVIRICEVAELDKLVILSLIGRHKTLLGALGRISKSTHDCVVGRWCSACEAGSAVDQLDTQPLPLQEIEEANGKLISARDAVVRAERAEADCERVARELAKRDDDAATLRARLTMAQAERDRLQLEIEDQRSKLDIAAEAGRRYREALEYYASLGEHGGARARAALEPKL